MEEARLKVFRELLESRLEALVRSAGTQIGELTGERENLPDAADIASEESSREFTLRMAERDRQAIAALRQALRRMDEGEYGDCVHCGEEISERRLMARPMSTHCIDCKTEVEMRGHGRASW